MNAASTADVLIHEYCGEYLSKLFYFCLKKTGSPTEAEDLSSDISLQIIAALKKGTVPENFSAWIFRIAKNRYRLWAIAKHRASELFDPDAETDSVPDDTRGVEDGLLLGEDIKLLRRELAFISSDYRNILIAFYIDDRSVKDIARSLDLPEGTVKTKLFRARKLLKEGINMAREFGPKSYKPENINFVANGSQPSGLPWSAVQTMFARNVLLEASDNPATLEELSIALGIASPYMEEEAERLVAATLLKKIGSKYVTNFPIVSAETHKKAFDIKLEVSPKRAELIDKIAEDLIPEIRRRFVRSDRITDEDIKWWAVCECSTVAETAHEGQTETVRENGESWTFYGFEDTDFYDPFVSRNDFMSDASGRYLSAFVPHEYNVAAYWNKLGIHSDAIPSVIGIIKSGKTYGSLSETEKKFVDELKMLVHVGEDGKIVPDVLWIPDLRWTDGGDSVCSKLFKSHPLFKELLELDGELYNRLLETVRAESNSLVKEQLNGVAGTLSHMRGLTVREEVNAGRLKVPEDPFNSVCTLAFYCGASD